MDPRISDIEDAALVAWPAAHVVECDGWKLRFHWNMTGRANSVWPNRLTGHRTVIERADAVERFYHGKLQPARYQICPISLPTDLGRELDARGYHRRPGASVQIAPLAQLVREVCDPPGADTRILPRPSDPWFAVQQDALAMDPASAGLRRSLIQGIEAKAGFAFTTMAEEPAAIGIGVIGGSWLGIFGMATAHRFRRQGAAVRVLRALARWGVENGAHEAYLQVFEQNEPAVDLYRKLGFTELYVYHYRVEPWPD
ncbi:MAG: GNAT family N-acetyltransferase [Candidatus Eisenbacteria bacterium]